MTKEYDGLGRGLDSLIPNKRKSATLGVRNQIVGPEEQISYVEPLHIDANPHQPRKQFEHQSIEELVDSIREHGILQPLIVSKTDTGYQLISGERRLRASVILEMKKVPVIIRKASEQEKLAIALIENVQRKDLNPIEKAWGYARLIEEFSLTQEEAAKKVGQPRASLANTLRLLKLPETIQKALTEEKITEGHAKVLLSIEDEKDQVKLFQKILHEQLTVRSVERHVRLRRPTSSFSKKKDPNILDIEDRLRQALGTKVEVKKTGSRGLIHIHWYSLEELKNLIHKLTRLQ